MKNDDFVRVLFLSLEKSHAEMFFLVQKELVRIHKKVECKTLDVSKFSYNGLFKDMFNKKKIQVIERIIEKNKPDILCMANDHMGINAAFVKVCNTLGIRSIAIQDGILVEQTTRSVFNILRWKNYLLWRLISLITAKLIAAKTSLSLGWRPRVIDWGFGGTTKIAVMGDFYKHLLTSRGVPSDKIVITGYPLLDNISRFASEFAKSAVFRELGISEGERFAVLITQPFVEDRIWSWAIQAKLVKSVIKAVEQIHHLHLVIKLHPREKIGKYKIIAKRTTNSKVVLTRDFNLHNLLLASSVVLSVSSTVGLWALAHKKPLITINCFPNSAHNIYQELAFNVNNLEDLPYILRKAVENQNARSCESTKLEAFLHDHIFSLDEHASKRIAMLILQLTGVVAQREK